MGFKDFALSLKARWAEDKAGDFAASITYFGLLAIFPFLLFLVALASVVIDPGQAEKLINELSRVAPGAATEILGGRIRALAAGNNGGLLTVGAVGALWAAAGGVVALMRGLNTVHRVEETRPFWKVRLIALAVTLFAALLSVVSALVMVAAGPVANALGGAVGTLILWLRFPVAALLMIFVWAVLYTVLPNRKLPLRLFSFGAIVGVLLWLAASWGFSVYVSHFGNYDATYGALGGVIVLLVWMYLSSSVLLLGAEMNRVLAEAERPEAEERGPKAASEREAPARAPAARPLPGHPERGVPAHALREEEPRPPSRNLGRDRREGSARARPVAREVPARRSALHPGERTRRTRQGWISAAAAGLVAGLAGFLYTRRA